MRGEILSWFELYIANKIQQTIVNDTVSDKIEVNPRSATRIGTWPLTVPSIH